MRLFGRSVLLIASALALNLPVITLADDADVWFYKARDAYQARNEAALTEAAQQLQSQQYLLAPYTAYWLTLLKLNQADNESVQTFLNQYPDYPFTDRLRGEWLKVLGKRQDWKTFLEEYPRFKRDDVAVTCYAIQARARSGEPQALSEARTLWLSPSEQPANCGQLFDDMQDAKVLQEADIWARLRLALAEGKLTLAKNIAQRLSKIDDANLKLIDRVYQNPQQVIDKKMLSSKTRFGRALNLFAIDRLARSNVDAAASAWKLLENAYDLEDRQYGWGRIALFAARQHDAAAIGYFEKAGKSLSQEQIAWKARSNLRAKDWPALLATINDMPSAQQDEQAWRYWKARALKMKKEIPAANAILVPLSRERTYYGLLAEEELGDVLSAMPSVYIPTEAEVAAVKNLPGIQRAIELQRFDMRWESRMEWMQATKDLDDKALIAGAELAVRQEWYDLAISTADRTSLTHNYALRYPTPYRSIIKTQAKEQAIDEAWVYGLTRQESRFVSYAKSGVGASGLMQLMPATANWVAKRLGLGGYSNGMIHQQDTNIKLGTYYLRYTLDLMGGQAVMATAAYNAGPGRAKRWGDGDTVEGAIYAETIPFYETRMYVQKVMANAYFYAHRLGTSVQTLKQRLGVVGGGELVLPNLPVPASSEQSLILNDGVAAKIDEPESQKQAN